MMVFELFVIALLCGALVLCVFVSVHDYKYRKIPNKYLIIASLFAISVFIAMCFYLPPAKVAKGFFFSLMGSLIGGMLLFAPYKLKQVGAGDVKLVMVFGLFLGFKGTMLSILVGAMVGGAWALGLAYRYGGLSHMWHNMKFMARSAYLSGFKDMGWDLRSEGAIAMPYGVALSIGCALIAIEQMHLYITRLLAA
jgi:prepilin peptidase CpaA